VVTLSRYIKKAITWRVVASIITMIFLYWATGKVDVVLTFGLIEAAVKVVAYVIHERIWENSLISAKTK
jgi:uncharacterized membrane protein